jgi:hypothetical protein
MKDLIEAGYRIKTEARLRCLAAVALTGVVGKMRLFGLSWSGIAFVGTLTDKNPTTNYEWGDAILTGSTYATGFLLPRIFKYRIVEFGKRKRLRIMDTRPSER